MSDTKKERLLKISILRFDPHDPEDVPHMETFDVEESDGMTLYIALNEIREHNDNSLKFDFVCRAGICGSCSMLVNGKPTLACKTLTAKLGEHITLAPLPLFELIGDLSIYTGKWMRHLNEHLETWIHDKEAVLNVDKLEERMEPALAEEIYEIDRCVECGCCVAGCGTMQMRPTFTGAVGLNKIARYHLDPRDKRSNEEYYELIGDEDGIFGCMTLLGCEDVCPKDLPLQSKIAYLRRMMIKTSMKN
ncbi:MAG: fumarate reductase iron-sulfur subunit [Sulfurimonas sp.]|jgi:fumarate reductase iron-sulfur subunit